jgi:DNA repair protein RadC
MDIMNVAEIKISYSTKVKPSDRPQIFSSKTSHEIFKKLPAYVTDMENRELFYAMYLNRANKCLGVRLISTGSINGCIAEPQ